MFIDALQPVTQRQKLFEVNNCPHDGSIIVHKVVQITELYCYQNKIDNILLNIDLYKYTVHPDYPLLQHNKLHVNILAQGSLQGMFIAALCHFEYCP